jgi:hypothetical protein
MPLPDPTIGRTEQRQNLYHQVLNFERLRDVVVHPISQSKSTPRTQLVNAEERISTVRCCCRGPWRAFWRCNQGRVILDQPIRGSNPLSPANRVRGLWLLLHAFARLAGGPGVSIRRRQILLPRRPAEPVAFTLILGPLVSAPDAFAFANALREMILHLCLADPESGGANPLSQPTLRAPNLNTP